MKTITLTHIELAHFKGIAQLQASFGHRSQIIGGNGTGKSTIPDAFHWCLFGSNAQGSAAFTVRPLDEQNQLIPDLEVKVSVALSVDGRPITFTRILSAGKKDNAATYCVNNVPCKMSEFDEKLNALCKKEDLKLLTSPSAFFALDTKAARAKLQQLSGTVSDTEVAAAFPAVAAALQEGKTADELKREVSAKKTKATDRLKQIPTAINAQEELRPKGVDFDTLRTSAKAKEQAIRAIDAQLTKAAEAHTPEREAAQADRTQLNELKEALQECEASIGREYRKRKTDLEDGKATALVSLGNKQRAATALEGQIRSMNQELDGHTEYLTQLGKAWNAANEEEFAHSPEPVCPTCRKPYTAQELGTALGTLVEQFNQDKLSRLGTIEAKAQEVQAAKQALTAIITESTQGLNQAHQELETLQETIKGCDDQLAKLPSVEQAKAANKERQHLCQRIEVLTAQINATKSTAAPKADDELAAQKAALQQQVAQIHQELGKEELNSQIDTRKAELKTEEKELAQAVADCEAVEAQIKAFGKRRIEMVEQAVASRFQLVRFKMYEPNLTNDGEKEVCECLVDGVPYNNLNTAKRVNAGLDIINGLSGALGVIAPVFIDGKESVTELIDTPAQLIALSVAEGKNLTIN